MRQLTIVRHAKSSWEVAGLDDFQRPLNPRGVKNAFAMGEALRQRGMMPETIICSPAARAMNTALILAQQLGYPQQRITTDARIYEAGTAQLMQVLAEVDDRIGHVMLFGHNPSLTDLINHLQPRPLDNLPTCGVLTIGLDMDAWAAIRDARGETAFSLFPKNL